MMIIYFVLFMENKWAEKHLVQVFPFFSWIHISTSIVLYALASLVGFANAGTFKDLSIWAGLNLIFAILLIVHLIRNKELYSKK